MTTGFNGNVMPDAMEGQVVGYRAWNVDEANRLRSMGMTEAPAWEPGLNQARCERIGFHSDEEPELVLHDAPNPDCSCGFYALNTLAIVFEEYSYLLQSGSFGGWSVGRRLAIGKVTLAGRVVVGTRGYRAQMARVVAIIERPEEPPSSWGLAEAYGVPMSDELLAGHGFLRGGPGNERLFPVPEGLQTDLIAIPIRKGPRTYVKDFEPGTPKEALYGREPGQRFFWNFLGLR